MPAGQPLGPRQFFDYTSDTGKVYKIKQRTVDGVAVSNPPNVSPQSPKPSGLRPRRLHLQFDSGSGIVRKAIMICQVSNPLYSGVGTVSIDGATWGISGRTGERAIGDAAV